MYNFTMESPGRASRAFGVREVAPFEWMTAMVVRGLTPVMTRFTGVFALGRGGVGRGGCGNPGMFRLGSDPMGLPGVGIRHVERSILGGCHGAPKPFCACAGLVPIDRPLATTAVARRATPPVFFSFFTRIVDFRSARSASRATTIVASDLAHYFPLGY